MTQKRWTLKKQPNSLIVNELANSLSINHWLAAMLVQRGICTFEDARNFFRPQLEHLHDPFLMKDMDKAIDRLDLALKNRERIMVYGDYDVDGTTSVALVYGFLSENFSSKNKEQNLLEFYIPDRYSEGYGISRKGIETASKNGVSLIICLDCGIKSVELVQQAKVEFNIDFIICDHHKPGDILPPAAAVLDNKRLDSTYPYDELSGCGVGFKFMQAMCQKRGISEEKVFEFLDLVVVSIASDIVPITGENRTLAFFGMKKLNENPRMGLNALKEVAGFQQEMTIENVVFGLGPRINAAGRIKHAEAAVNLLLSDNYQEALDFAQVIHKHNTERKIVDSNITEQALAMIEGDDFLMNAKSTVLFKEDWHKGVIGIVASRCIEKYYRPTIILTKKDDTFAAGSARTVSGFNLYEAIEECADLLEQFGGHFHAAGMTLPLENIEKFRFKFDKIVSERITEEQLTPQIEVDLKITLGDINQKFYNIVRQMSPFGPQNMQPNFMTENLRLVSKPQILKEKHLKLELLEVESGVVMPALGFWMSEEFLEQLNTSDTFSICYQIEENNFRGQKTLQLFLKDIKCENSL